MAFRHYAIPRYKFAILTKCHFPVGETPELRAVLFREQVAALFRE
jgi:hypothetical protein